VLTAAEVTDAYIVALDPGGAARLVDLPATTDLAGQEFRIYNSADAAETLTVRLTGAGATVVTIAQGEIATLTCFSATAGSWSGTVARARLGTVLTATLAADRVLTAAEAVDNDIIALDPGGAARNVDLPATAATLAGRRIQIINTADAAETLTVRLTAGGTTVATIDQNEHAWLTCYSATAGSWVGSVSKAT
jgi:hypothetical protein